MASYISNLESIFLKKHQEKPQIKVSAPGRINLIGEHTDYNMGYVLPAAIDKAIYYTVSKRSDEELHFYALNLDESYVGNLNHIVKSSQAWVNYLLACIQQMQISGMQMSGVNIVLGGDIPLGAGVSSSAAVENGMLFCLNELFDCKISKIELIRMAQRAENQFIGLNCGIMDMFASMMGKANACLRLDCQDLSFQYFPFSMEQHALILCDTGVKHSLADSEYNTRRQECESGVSIIQKSHPTVNSLRDVDMAMLVAHQHLMSSIVYQRCRYVILENERVLSACLVLESGDLESFGKLMYASHEGLQHDYSVSCTELDFLVSQTHNLDYVLGARMMGGGFGGCTLNLVHQANIDTFISTMQNAYQTAFNRELPCHICKLSDGVKLL